MVTILEVYGFSFVWAGLHGDIIWLEGVVGLREEGTLVFLADL